MKISLKLAALGLICSYALSGIAFADGIGSKLKSRMPSDGGMLKRGTNVHGLRPIDAKLPPGDIAISVLIRKNLRLQTKQNVASDDATVRTKRNGETTINPALKIDRLKLIKRGQSAQPMHCITLHTHARAVCQRDALLGKSDTRVKLVQNARAFHSMVKS